MVTTFTVLGNFFGGCQDLDASLIFCVLGTIIAVILLAVFIVQIFSHSTPVIEQISYAMILVALIGGALTIQGIITSNHTMDERKASTLQQISKAGYMVDGDFFATSRSFDVRDSTNHLYKCAPASLTQDVWTVVCK